MANLSLDLSNEAIIHPKASSASYVFKDIGTENFTYKIDSVTGKESVTAINTSNVNLDAVRASIRNILNFKNGEDPLDPELGISKVYEMIYAPFDKYTTQKMINILKGIISYYEPRIEIISMPTIYDDEKGEFVISLNYHVPKLNVKDTYVITLSK